MAALNNFEYVSNRPDVLCQNGAVACTNPYAATIGLEILKAGGNAADAAVAVAATLNVTNPMCTGIGGDAFCLYYDAKTKKVQGLNGSGRSPGQLTLDLLRKEGFGPGTPPPTTHGHMVTVPGAAAAWCDAVKYFGSGKLSMKRILQPAIDLAENGHVVMQVPAYFWQTGSSALKAPRNIHGSEMLIEGQAPKWGQVFKNQNLAKVFTKVAEAGAKGFYEGEVAAAIVEAVRHNGGVMTLDDLKGHTSTLVEPISTEYKGVRLWEIPPNGQGIVALMTLNILKGFDMKALGHNSSEYLHVLAEALSLSFASALAFVADPSKEDVPVTTLLSEKFAEQRRKLITDSSNPDKFQAGDLRMGSDTVYFTVSDKEGNACSFINSNYMGFGTGIVPASCGFTLQNRGYNFSLEEGHPNAFAPNKRPYHTIIPAMLTDAKTGDLLASYGVMGGFMQPQGHVQVLLNLLEFHMSPQRALDMPRICLGPGHTGITGSVAVEEGIPQSVIDDLRKKGHDVDGPKIGHDRALFGRGHVITRGAWWKDPEDDSILDDKSVYWVGSDPRAGGMAIGY